MIVIFLKIGVLTFGSVNDKLGQIKLIISLFNVICGQFSASDRKFGRLFTYIKKNWKD